MKVARIGSVILCLLTAGLSAGCASTASTPHDYYAPDEQSGFSAVRAENVVISAAASSAKSSAARPAESSASGMPVVSSSSGMPVVSSSSGMPVASSSSSKPVVSSSSSKPVVSSSSSKPVASSSSSKPVVSSSSSKPAPEPEPYIDCNIDENERRFIDGSLFVGDSICRGFYNYELIGWKNSYATASVAARNFFDMSIYYCGEEMSFKSVLQKAKPKRVVLSMGMNDVNMTSASEYCENYSAIIRTALENSDAEIFVCAITPIRSGFTSDGRIDAFNDAMKKYIAENYSARVRFADFTQPLKDSSGHLRKSLADIDGIHLSPAAYYVALEVLAGML